MIPKITRKIKKSFFKKDLDCSSYLPSCCSIPFDDYCKNVDSFKIAAEQETRVLDIEKAKRIEIEEKKKEQEVLEKSKSVLKIKMEEEIARA